MNPPFKINQLYRNRHPCHGSGWCRHGIVKIEFGGIGQLIAVDTYWGSETGNTNAWPVEELEGHLEFLLDLDECRRSHREEFDVYRDEDRAYIPIGGGSEQWWVRNDAQPDIERQIAQAEEKLLQAIADERYARVRIEEQKAALKELRRKKRKDAAG